MRSTSAAAGRVLGLLSLFLVASVVAGALLAGLFVPAIAAAGGATRGSISWFNDLKAVPPATQLSQQSLLLAKDGTIIARFYNENRSEVPLSKISVNMQNAIIAIEDARFRDHGGVDPIGLVRAAASDYLGNGTEVQGASTLTQQYIKNLYLEQAVYAGDKTAQEAAVARDANRKILEIRAAIDLEKTLTKDQILERYLNIAYFGNNAYGVEAAAELYFSVSAAKLSVVQAALLAGIVQSPDTYDPFRHKTNSLARRNTVLSRMHELGMLQTADYTKAVATKVTLKRKTQQSGCIAAIQGLGFFCQYVRNLIASGTESFSALGNTRAERINALDRGGLRITTSIDLRVQTAAQNAIAKYLKIGDPSKAGTAAVTVEPGTGHVLAMAENKTYSPKASASSTEINYAVDATLGGSTGFQTGSTFKAFTLATWLKEGKALNDVIDSDVGTLTNADFTECNGQRLGRGDPYKPQNSEPTEGGKMSVLTATANSVNTAFVAMSQQLELCQIAATAKSLGVHLAAPKDFGCSQATPIDIPQCIKAMTLGPFSISPLTMATAYATFAADGTYCPAFPVLAIKKADGKTVPVKAPDCKQNAIDPDVAHAVTYALKRVITNGTATDVDGIIKAPVAGKTGTTDNSVDTWFVGYTHARATAVWVGDNPTVASGTLRKSLNRLHVIGGHDYGGQSIFGATIAAPIWARIMQVAVPGSDTSDWDAPPSDMLGSSGSGVPDVTGKSVSDAIGILSGAGFSPQVGAPVDSNVPAGQVASTSPGSGATANQGATVTIHPSTGKGAAQPAANKTGKNKNTTNNKKKRRGPPPRL